MVFLWASLKGSQLRHFEPDAGELEVYQLDDSGRYQLCNPDTNNRYWIAQMGLFWGDGKEQKKSDRLLVRWWDENGELLLWVGKIEQLEERAERLAAT